MQVQPAANRGEAEQTNTSRGFLHAACCILIDFPENQSHPKSEDKQIRRVASYTRRFVCEER